MTQPVLLNSQDHRHLKVRTERSAELGDAIMSALTFPAEFRSVQACYPIVFQQSSEGVVEPVALFGLSAGENLFLGPTGWDATYLPLSVERQPFMIGFEQGKPMVLLDRESPRVSESRGQPLFMEHGGTSDYLQRMTTVLGSLHDGLQSVPPFVAALQRQALLESFVLDVESGNGDTFRLSGFLTVNEERLSVLGAADLATLHAAGYLQAIYMVLASQARFRELIERRSRKVIT